MVTHIYHPQRGAFRNLCELPAAQAQRIISQMRECGRSRLTPEYLRRRLETEDWLMREASALLPASPSQRPLYGFLGSFGHLIDPSRPCAVQVPLAVLGAVTFTLGDSMRVAARADRRLFSRAELEAMASAGALHSFSTTDAGGCPGDFLEVQIWDRAGLPIL
jgi:hypothetical protein